MSETNTETKWRPENLGPRQAKQFNEAISKFGWEAKTTGEITDYSDGKPHYSVVMFGGSWSPLARELMDAIRTKYNLTVTGDNYKAIIADLEAATARHAKEGRPVVDRRRSPEEKAEIDRARQEREAKEAAKAAHLATLQHHVYDLPETAKAIKRVLLTLWPNTSFSVKSERYSMGYSINASWTDGPTDADVKAVLDVFQTKHFDGMQDLETDIGPSEWSGHLWKFQGGYTSGSRAHSAAFLHDVADRFTRETGLPAPTIREEPRHVWIEREGGACGWSFSYREFEAEEHPNGILAKDDVNHWTAADVVGQMAHHTRMEAATFPLGRRGYTDEYAVTQDTVYRILMGELGNAPAADTRPHVDVEGITVFENDAKDGVEIRFPDKPAAAVLDSLKSHGWRWSRFSKCWYHKRTPTVLAYAHALVGPGGTAEPAGREDAGLAAMTDVDAQYERQCEDAVLR